MGLPRITYDAGGGPVSIDFQRGPQNFRAFSRARVNDNLATSGLRERVLEHIDILIAFEMRHLRIDEDLPAWAAFAAWSLGGGQFEFKPDKDLTTYYHCVNDAEGFEPTRTGPGWYTVEFLFRVVPDSLAPAHPAEILRRFYGIAS